MSEKAKERYDKKMENSRKKKLFYSSWLLILIVCLMQVGQLMFLTTRLLAKSSVSLKVVEQTIREKEVFHLEITDERGIEDIGTVTELDIPSPLVEEDEELDGNVPEKIKRSFVLSIPEGLRFDEEAQKSYHQEIPTGAEAPVYTWNETERQLTILMDALQTSIQVAAVGEQSGEYTLELTDKKNSIEPQEVQVSILDIDKETNEASAEENSLNETDTVHVDGAKDETNEDLREPVLDSNFVGRTVEVTTFEQLRLAVADSEVGTVEVRDNLTRSGTGVATAIGAVGRSLLIKGNGYTINFGENNGSLGLSSLAENETTIVRLENATITKAGEAPIFNAAETGKGWTLEFESITEGPVNGARLASIPEGRMVFTGGENQFARTIAGTFISVKEIEFNNKSIVNISRASNAYFFSAATIANPSIVLKENSKVTIVTTSGPNNPIAMRGDNPTIIVKGNSDLELTSPGNDGVISDLSNNVIAMTGNNPTFTVIENSSVNVSTTNNKRGIVLIGSTPTVTVKDSKITVTGVAGSAVHVNGQDATMNVINANLTITTTTGRGLDFTGERAWIDFKNSEVTVAGQMTTRIYISGNEGKFSSTSTKGRLRSTRGWGIYLTGGSNTFLVDDGSDWEITSSDNAQNIGILSSNPKLHVVNNSSLTLSSEQGETINLLLEGINPEIRVENQSNVSLTTSGTTANPTATSNLAVSLKGDNPILSAVDKSTFKVNVAENAKRGVNLNGVEPKVSIENSIFDIQVSTGNPLRFEGSSPSFTLNNAKLTMRTISASNILFMEAGANFSATNSELNLIGETSGNGLYYVKGNSKFELINSKVEIETASGFGINMTGNNNEITVTNKSEVIMNSKTGNNIVIIGDNAKLTVTEGAVLKTTTGTASAIELIGSNPIVRVLHTGTKIQAKSNYIADTDSQATIFIGSKNAEVRREKYLIEVGNGAVLDVKANVSSAIQVGVNDGYFLVSDQGKLQLESGNTNSTGNIGTSSNANAALRFSRTGPVESTGNHNFVIDNAAIEIKKTDGNAPGIRMFGHNNQVLVKNNGYFTVHNTGNGTASNGNLGGGNQGIHYVSGSDNKFTVTDPGSKVLIDASSGPAIDMGAFAGNVTVSNHGYFEASGKTSTAAGGIFNGKKLMVTFDNPLFMNFRNNRSSGGNIFNGGEQSILNAKKSDLSVWKNGADLDGDPDLNFPTLDFTFIGTNFNTLQSTNKPKVLNTETFGVNGLTDYSRLSSNNARWVIVDELRVPTNADKRIYGHVSIPVGLEGNSRSAWDEEATVTVEVERLDGSKEEYTAKTVGHSNRYPGISIYGEKPRGGLFEIKLADFLQAGDKVSIKEAKLTSGNLTQGHENIILTDTVMTFPIVPPKPAEFSSDVVKTTDTMIAGHSDNVNVDVTATHNGKAIDTPTVVVDSSGNFEIPLTEVTLAQGDEIQVFLRDKAGSAENARVIEPPKTNNEGGNINPSNELTFHDAVFVKAKVLTVEEAYTRIIVEFVNELDQLIPEYTINLDKVSDKVDMTKEQKVMDQLSDLTRSGYEITERPENETVISLEDAEMKVRYKIQGGLSLTSAPKSLDFGSLTYNATTQRVDNPTIDQPLIVTDTRADTANGWTLTAALTTPMKNTEGKELIDALRFVYEGEETIVDANAQNVYLNKNGLAGSLNVSNTWGNQAGTDGMKLQIGSSDIVYTGSYTGVITWKIMAGQP